MKAQAYLQRSYQYQWRYCSSAAKYLAAGNNGQLANNGSWQQANIINGMAAGS